MSKKKKAIVIIALLSIIILSFIGGKTYSKYVSQITGNGVAQIATWSFKVNGSEEQRQTINLASTYNNETLINNKIAPGTSGNFNIVIDGTGSDVGINYKIQCQNEGNLPENFKFIYNNQEYSKLSEIQDAFSGTINANDTNKKITLPIKWEWKYETGSDATQIANNDKIDTQNAKDISTYSVDLVISGTQVVPQ